MKRHKWKFMELVEEHYIVPAGTRLKRYKCEVCGRTGSFGLYKGKYRRSNAFKAFSWLSDCDLVIIRSVIRL